MRKIELNVEVRSRLFEILAEQDYDGYEYVRTLREENEQPLLLLRAE